MKMPLLSIAVLSIVPIQAMADTPTFDFVELGLVGNLGGSPDFDGFEIKGNLTLNDRIYMNAAYANTDINRPFGDIATDIITLGLGYRTDITNVSTLFTEVDYLRVDSSRFGSEDGYQVGFGVRTNVSRNVELKAAGYFRDVQGSDTFVQLGAVYNLTSAVGFYVDVESNFDDTAYSLGVRYSFGR